MRKCRRNVVGNEWICENTTFNGHDRTIENEQKLSWLLQQRLIHRRVEQTLHSTNDRSIGQEKSPQRFILKRLAATNDITTTTYVLSRSYVVLSATNPSGRYVRHGTGRRWRLTARRRSRSPTVVREWTVSSRKNDRRPLAEPPSASQHSWPAPRVPWAPSSTCPPSCVRPSRLSVLTNTRTSEGQSRFLLRDAPIAVALTIVKPNPTRPRSRRSGGYRWSRSKTKRKRNETRDNTHLVFRDVRSRRIPAADPFAALAPSFRRTRRRRRCRRRRRRRRRRRCRHFDVRII